MVAGFPNARWGRVREVVHVGALVFVIEKVIGGCKRYHVTPVFAERYLHETDVEVRRVVGRGDKIRMGRDVRTPRDLGIQEAVVENALGDVEATVTERTND